MTSKNSSYSGLEDKVLLCHYRERRDNIALRTLLRRYVPMIRALARGNREIEDAGIEGLENGILRVLKGNMDYRNISGYLFRSIKNKILDYERKKKGRVGPVSLEQDIPVKDSYPNNERSSVLRKVLESLSGRQRNILKLRYWSGKTYQDIGLELGVTKLVAFREHAKIMGILRSKLKESYGKGP